MDRKELETKIKNFLVEEIEVEEELLKDEALLKEDLGIDSLDFVDIVVIVEKEFGYKIKQEEIKPIKTLKQFYDYLESKINGAA